MTHPKFRIIGITLAGSFLMTGVILSLFVFQMRQFITTPCSTQERSVIFTISPGQNLPQVAANLEAQGLITSQALFKLYVRYKRSATRLKAGEYELSGHTPGRNTHSADRRQGTPLPADHPGRTEYG